GELDTVEVVLRHDHLFAVGKPVERVDELLAPLGGEQVGSRDRTPAVGELVCVRVGITVAATAVEADEHGHRLSGVAGTLAGLAGNPVAGADRVDDRSADAGHRVGLESNAAGRVVALPRLGET